MNASCVGTAPLLAYKCLGKVGKVGKVTWNCCKCLTLLLKIGICRYPVFPDHFLAALSCFGSVLYARPVHYVPGADCCCCCACSYARNVELTNGRWAVSTFHEILNL